MLSPARARRQWSGPSFPSDKPLCCCDQIGSMIGREAMERILEAGGAERAGETHAAPDAAGN